MKERIKLLRKKLNITQDKFSSKINISRPHFAAIENGSKNITKRLISDICREFNVNENWLREGTGEMFCSLDKFSLDDYLNNKGLNDEDKEIFKKIADVYVKINDDERKNFVKSLIDTIEIAFK